MAGFNKSRPRLLPRDEDDGVAQPTYKNRLSPEPEFFGKPDRLTLTITEKLSLFHAISIY
jgi:hypothetical protein